MRPQTLCYVHLYGLKDWKGDDNPVYTPLDTLQASWFGRHSCDQEVQGWTTGRGVTTLGKLFTPLIPCRSQYNLVPVNEQ